MKYKVILASKSNVRKEILLSNNFNCEVIPSNIDEDIFKKSYLQEKISPENISKNLAELKANKVSLKKSDSFVLGADSVLDLDGELISKPKDRLEALKILRKLNGKTHDLISSVCISKNGAMVWHYSERASLTMKNMSEVELNTYLSKITDEALYSYNVYQIEGEGKNLFSDIKGSKDTIMGLPIKKIKQYFDSFEQ